MEHVGKRKISRFRTALAAFGPAWVISAVAAGPGTTLSVAKAGGTYGYSFLWVIVLLAFVCQYMAAKTALIGGSGIVGIVEEKWGNSFAWLVTLDALLVIWLCNVVLLKVLVAVTGFVTGMATPFWGVFFVAVFYGLVAWGGYKIIETICKLIVSLLVFCFIATLFIAKPDLGLTLGGLIPNFTTFGKPEILMMTAIMGGSIHVSILSMQTYTVHEKGWKKSDLKLALTDTAVSLLGDKMKWDLKVGDKRYKRIILAGCLIALPGAFLPGKPVNLLMLMLALSFVGTPLFVGIFLKLLNDRDWAKENKNTALLNIGGGLAFFVTIFLGVKWVLQMV